MNYKKSYKVTMLLSLRNTLLTNCKYVIIVYTFVVKCY